MNSYKNYPNLIGVTKTGYAEEIPNTLEGVSDFICKKGVDGDLVILTPDGNRLLNTFGVYVDRCSDFGYMEALRPVLTEKQQQLEKNLKLTM